MQKLLHAVDILCINYYEAFQRKKRANSWNDCHSRMECLNSKSAIKNLLGFRACNFQHVSLASGRAVFSSCGADPSKAKKRLPAPTYTASQLVRTVFQSTMGSHEGAFSAEPAAGDHPWGGLGDQGAAMVGSPTHPVMPHLVMPWKMSPPSGRGAGGCQVVPTRTRSPACTALWCPDRPPSSGLGRGDARPPPTPAAAGL
jgi:hypothetical protein